MMRSEGNPLDLNNLPEDYCTRDGKQTSEDSSSSAGVYKRKKSGVNNRDGKDDSGKVYECRFCSLKFCKSQALGGHMNRHRQERETEMLNKARHLVFTNDLVPTTHHLGYGSSGEQNPNGAYPQTGNMGDPHLLSMYPTRLFSTSSPLISPPPLPPRHQAAPPYVYNSPPRLLSFPSQFQSAPPMNDYFVGHVLSNSSYGNHEGNYTCIGAPVGPGWGPVGTGAGGRDNISLQNREEGSNWGRR